MNVFLAYVRDPAYFDLLPRAPRAPSDGRIRVMAFPPLGIQTLAPVDPDTLPNDEVNRLRMKGYASLLLRRILARPFRTWDLLRTFSRHMAWGDLLRLVSGPFRTKAASAPALPARMVDAGLRAPARKPKVLVPMGSGSTSPS